MPATILIAIGGAHPGTGDSLNRFGVTELFQFGKFLGVVFLFAGFLVSIEVFRDDPDPVHVDHARPSGRHESPAARQLAAVNEAPAERPAEATGAG